MIMLVFVHKLRGVIFVEEYSTLYASSSNRRGDYYFRCFLAADVWYTVARILLPCLTCSQPVLNP